MVATRLSFAVIPTHDRPVEFATCVAAITPQVDRVIAVCHGPVAFDYATTQDVDRVMYAPDGRANISHMWNLGIDHAQRIAGHGFDVAILNDDAIPAPDWFAILTARMRVEGAAGVSERRWPGSSKLAGWAFILNGDAGLRADERLVHWFGDDDLQRQAERWAFVDDVTTPNTQANSTSRDPEARAQIERDAAAFAAKWAS